MATESERLNNNQIGLSPIIEELKNGVVQLQDDDYSSISDSIQKRAMFPNDFSESKVVVQEKGSGENACPYFSVVTQVPGERLDDIQEVIRRLHEKVVTTNLPNKKKYPVEIKFNWQLEDFLNEESMPRITVNDSLKIRKNVYEIDPDKPRMLWGQGRVHRFEAELKGGELKVSLTGKYRNRSEELISELKPQLATLRLDKKDAERVIAGLEKSERADGVLGKFMLKSIKTQLEPRSTVYVGVSPLGMNAGVEEIIETKVPTGAIPFISASLGRSLLHPSPKQETKIVSFEKLYWGRKKQELIGKDVKLLAGFARGSELGIVCDHPVITRSQAKDLIEQEFKILEDMYKNPMRYVMAYSGSLLGYAQIRAGAVWGFTEEVLDKQTANLMDEAKTKDFVAHLNSRGYLTTTLEDDNEHGADEYKNEMHLFNFLKQLYSKDPDLFAKNYSESRVNKGDELDSIDIDLRSARLLTKANKIVFPNKSRITAYVIKTPLGDNNYNRLGFSDFLYGDDSYLLFVNQSSLEKPDLLKLQETVLEDLGITFTP